MRRELKFYTKQDFLNGRVFFRIFPFYIIFDYNWVCVYKYRKIKYREITSLQRPETWWTWRVISIITKNKPRAHHKAHLRTIKVYNTWSVYSLSIEVFTEVFTCSQVINAFKRKNAWTDAFHVFWHQSFLSCFYKIKHVLEQVAILIPSFHSLR